MAADAQSAPTPIWRHDELRSRVERMGLRVDKNVDRLAELEKKEAANEVSFHELRADVHDLRSTLNKLIWSIVGLALTIAGSAVGLVIAAGIGHP